MGQRKQKYTYERRRPELTPCYKIIQSAWESFKEDRELEQRPLPQYVNNEFEAFLRCGIFASGFLRLKCEACGEEKITAFSCKQRGFCPSCTGRRMSEAACHLVDHILLMVPYRQFVITFPYPLRYWLNTNTSLFKEVHDIITNAIQAHYKALTNLPTYRDPKAGIVSFTQRFGSALNLNPHIHLIATDGMHYRPEDPLFRKAKPPTDADISILLTRITSRVLSLLQKKGYLDQHGEIVNNPLRDSLFKDYESIDMATQASIAGRIAFGPN